MNRKAEVAVLVATYNGEKYLGAQLESIAAQSYTDWTIIFSDDGSSDKTRAIIDEFMARFPDRSILLEKEKPSGSAKKNFMALTRFAADFPYIMYCDQDDYWMPDKIQSTFDRMRALENGEEGVPCLVFSDLEVVDSELRTISLSFMEYSGLKPERRSLNRLLVENVAAGCTVMINRSLRELASRPADDDMIEMHDWWCALIAAAAGRIYYIPRPLIKYRQHGSNAVGAQNGKHTLLTVTDHLKKGKKADITAILGSMAQAGLLASTIPDKMSEEDMKMASDYSEGAGSGKLYRVRTAFRYGMWKGRLVGRIGQIVYY